MILLKRSAYLVLCLGVFLSVSSKAATIPDLDHVYSVFYESKKIGESKHTVRSAKNKQWFVESTRVVFESFFGDDHVSGITIERYDSNKALQDAFYLVLYDEYLIVTRLSTVSEKLLKQEVKVYELSDPQLDQLIASWAYHVEKLTSKGEVNKEMNSFLSGLEVEERYSNVVALNEFEYSTTVLPYILPKLLEDKISHSVSVFDPESVEQQVYTVRIDRLADNLREDSQLFVEMYYPDDHSSCYWYNIDKKTYALTKIHEGTDDDVVELRLESN